MLRKFNILDYKRQFNSMDDDHTTTTSTSSDTVSDTFADGTELFQEPDIQPVIKHTLALFGVVGLSLGLTAYVTLSAFLGGGGVTDAAVGFALAVVVLFLVVFIGVVLAVIVARTVPKAITRSVPQTGIVCTGSCYAGMVLFTSVVFVFVRPALPPIVAAEFGFGRVLLLSLLIGVPAALVAGVVVWLDERYLSTRTPPIGGST